MAKTLEELMNMSDEELLGKVDPIEESTETTEEIVETKSEDTTDDDPNTGEDTVSGSTEETSDEDEDDNTDGDVTEDGGDDDTSDDADDTSKSEDKKKPDDKNAKPSDDKKTDDKTKETKTETKNTSVVEPDYKKAYEQIMKPFRANGKEIKLENIDEAVKLMQMGANYTKKMQALQPNLKIIKMLENNQLLDENKLNLLIDMTKGSKEAFAKFAKDSGIDPMDIDTESAITYNQGNHAVSDSTISFSNIVEEINTSETGQALIVEMHKEWDQPSKQAIFDEPELIRVLAQQKADGIYDQIADVVYKQKVLGNPQIASLPFIKAYELVGKQLQSKGLLKAKSDTSGAPVDPDQLQQTTQELGRGTAPKKKTVTNDAKAKAAAPSTKTSKKVTQEFNPLEGTDEEFLKRMENRV